MRVSADRRGQEGALGRQRSHVRTASEAPFCNLHDVADWHAKRRIKPPIATWNLLPIASVILSPDLRVGRQMSLELLEGDCHGIPFASAARVRSRRVFSTNARTRSDLQM